MPARVAQDVGRHEGPAGEVDTGQLELPCLWAQSEEVVAVPGLGVSDVGDGRGGTTPCSIRARRSSFRRSSPTKATN